MKIFPLFPSSLTISFHAIVSVTALPRLSVYVITALLRFPNSSVPNFTFAKESTELLISSILAFKSFVPLDTSTSVIFFFAFSTFSKTEIISIYASYVLANKRCSSCELNPSETPFFFKFLYSDIT